MSNAKSLIAAIIKLILSNNHGGYMSQHLINDFIHRATIFKPLTGEKIVNKKLVKYQASNRKNNTSPQDREESVHDIKTDTLHLSEKVEAIKGHEKEAKQEVRYKKLNKSTINNPKNVDVKDDEPTEHIDIIV